MTVVEAANVTSCARLEWKHLTFLCTISLFAIRFCTFIVQSMSRSKAKNFKVHYVRAAHLIG